MIFNKLILILGLISLFNFSYGQLNRNTTVSGKVQNSSGSVMVYLAELSGNSMTILDSTITDGAGSFSLSAQLTGANYFQLTLGGEAYTILILEPNQRLKIDIDANNLMSPKNISGSEQTSKVYQMLNVMNSYRGQQEALEAQYQKVYGTPAQDSVGALLIDKYQKIEGLKLNYLKDEISSSPGLASLLFIDQLPIDEHLETYVKLDKVINTKYPDNPFVSDLHRKVAAKMLLAPGQIAPEINLPSPSGEYIKLSSLRGKVVLIDFWASWCSPCRRENPNVVKLYKQYQPKGFEIYGVSLDKEKSKWVEAISQDQLTWVHVSDLRFWSSVAAKDYGVGSIPFTVLIDRDGKVIATGLRGDALAAKLAELMKE
ncbi:MAG: AhpC/TSA family protein [Bacteroidales bacterium]|nr:AhpC/TSA family protein [Bacteroidales bacterium]